MNRRTPLEAFIAQADGTLDREYKEERRKWFRKMAEYFADMDEETYEWVRLSDVYMHPETVQDINPMLDERDGVEFATDEMEMDDRTVPVNIVVNMENWERTNGQIF